MHNLDLILTLAGGFTAALILGYLTQRAGLSPIVGYLIAGTLVGPHTPGFVANAEIAEQLAEVGVILLMFGVGLQFHVEELLAVRRVAIPGAIAQSAAATALGAVIARLFGWSWAAGIVFGMALAVASTVVLIRVLADHRDLHTPTGHVAVGWLVVEDLFTVLALVLLPVLFADGGSQSSIVAALGITALKVVLLVGFTAAVGTRVIPYVLDRVADTGSRELFTLAVLTIAMGIAVGSASVFGVSMALGAFLAGLVVGRSDYSLRAASDALPMRDAFAVLFFVAVGMLLSPQYVLDAPGVILATLAVVMIGKPLVAIVIVRLLGYPFKVALSIAVALAQIGEFSFILSSMGRELGILPAEATHTLVAASIVSIVLNPILYRTVAHVDRWAATHPRLWKLLNPPLREGAGWRTRGTKARSGAARSHRRLRSHWPHRRPPASRQRHRIRGRRAQYGHGTPASRRRQRRRIWRCDQAGHSRSGGCRACRVVDSHFGWDGRCRRGDSDGSRAEPARYRCWPARRIFEISPTCRKPAPIGCSRVKAKSRSA